MQWPTVAAHRLEWVTVEQMRRLDRLAVESGLALPVMMENAGGSLARVVAALWGGPARVEVLVGVGGNGGGAAVAARHLANRGWQVVLRLAPTGALAEVTARQVGLARLAGARVTARPPGGTSPVVDGLLGYGLAGDPRGEQARLISAVGDRPVVALDVPSGLELATGRVRDPAVRADVTVTLAAAKEGLRGNREVVGRLLVADLGIPRPLYARAGIAPPRALRSSPLVQVVDRGGRGGGRAE